MRIADLDYHLPGELIAQEPLANREASRMLVVDRLRESYIGHDFVDLPKFLRPDDVLVLNDTKVFPARLFGRTDTGAGVEIFLVSEFSDGTWEALARPGRRLKSGKIVIFDESLRAEVIERSDDGKVRIRFETESDLFETLDCIGRTPLPPYIKREKTSMDADRERYQTVFARNRGAIAAPTAGLHFTSDVLDSIKKIGVSVTELTLHVGYGTFEPVRVDELSEHRVASEKYTITNPTADLLNDAKDAGRRIIAVGTTTTRALENTITKFGVFVAGSYSAEITVTPGYSFKAIDGLLTNFHLPQSSLLLLTSIFGGHELIMSAYRRAVDDGYRFYSYGDCMLII
jgi:S-adenosylmethionine:tRNA ribosyltransferase-isomerase